MAGRIRTSHTPINLIVPTDLYREWEQAAKETGHTVDSYLINTLVIATRLRLLQGVQRMPRQGAAIDPLLAEAIRRNSEGKPWQHKADLLLATPGLVRDSPLPAQPDPRMPSLLRPMTAQQLVARYGLPVQRPAGHYPYSIIGGEPFTWNQTSLILAIWEHAKDAWTGRRVADHGASAGLPGRTVETCLRTLVKRGAIESKPHPTHYPSGSNRTARRQLRLEPGIADAIGSGLVRAA